MSVVSPSPTITCGVTPEHMGCLFPVGFRQWLLDVARDNDHQTLIGWLDNENVRLSAEEDRPVHEVLIDVFMDQVLRLQLETTRPQEAKDALARRCAASLEWLSGLESFPDVDGRPAIVAIRLLEICARLENPGILSEPLFSYHQMAAGKSAGIEEAVSPTLRFTLARALSRNQKDDRLFDAWMELIHGKGGILAGYNPYDACRSVMRMKEKRSWPEQPRPCYLPIAKALAELVVQLDREKSLSEAQKLKNLQIVWGDFGRIWGVEPHTKTSPYRKLTALTLGELGLVNSANSWAIPWLRALPGADADLWPLIDDFLKQVPNHERLAKDAEIKIYREASTTLARSSKISNGHSRQYVGMAAEEARVQRPKGWMSKQVPA